MNNLAIIVLQWMIWLQPVNTPALRPEVANAYPALAADIASAAEANPLLGDPRRTAAVLTVIAYRESRFDQDAIGDSGASRGAFQVWKGWKGPPSASTALHLVHTSFKVCRDRPISERLGWYAAGGVGCVKRLALSRARLLEAARLAALTLVTSD